MINGIFLIHSALIENLETKLRIETLPEDEIISIAQRLNGICGQIQNEALKERYQRLCGNVHWLKVDREVDAIVDAAMTTRSPSLLGRIEQVRKDHALSIESRKLINFAEQCIGQTEDLLLNVSLKHFEGTESEIANELYELAALLYNNQMREAKALFTSLDSRVQELLNAHFNHLGATLEKPSSLTKFNENIMKLLRGVIGAAYQLTKAGISYPSCEEVIEFFRTPPIR